jgi:HAD superfamily hydrolase (TIGR01549 family)
MEDPMNNFSKVSLFFLSIVPTGLFTANIIFDLGGVLIEPNKTAVAMKAGFLRLGFYAITHMENPRTSLFNILNGIEPYTESTIITYDETSTPLPGIMCDWLKGIPSKKILGKIKEKMSTKHALWPLANTIFEPQSMASTEIIIESGKKFVQECIEQGHGVYILSNWDAESFTYMQQQYPEFFNLFSGIVISGDCGLLKPDPRIYRHLLLQYQLDPKECFFIDNQVENITAAAAVGIQGTFVETSKGYPDFEQARKDMTTWLRSQLQYV